MTQRLSDKCAALCDAGSLSVETPRFVVIEPGEYDGFTLRQVAAGIFELATVPAEEE